jgi:hypothetical protein
MRSNHNWSYQAFRTGLKRFSIYGSRKSDGATFGCDVDALGTVTLHGGNRPPIAVQHSVHMEFKDIPYLARAAVRGCFAMWSPECQCKDCPDLLQLTTRRPAPDSRESNA